jgi:hypothetical protein
VTCFYPPRVIRSFNRNQVLGHHPPPCAPVFLGALARRIPYTIAVALHADPGHSPDNLKSRHARRIIRPPPTRAAPVRIPPDA